MLNFVETLRLFPFRSAVELGAVLGEGRAFRQKCVLTARWSTRILLGQNFDRNVTKFTTFEALKLIARGKSIFDESVAIHRVAGHTPTDR